ncbi:MAG: hypothetical protein J4431_03735 [Candidatus Aenigmarchaeota archaeon]|nr:hypothetical protein [Candidatus Aenigmarchaeota archaeon]
MKIGIFNGFKDGFYAGLDPLGALVPRDAPTLGSEGLCRKAAGDKIGYERSKYCGLAAGLAFNVATGGCIQYFMELRRYATGVKPLRKLSD